MSSQKLSVILTKTNATAMSCNCGPLPIFPYRVVQNLKERNSLPCSERMRGMKVVVIQGVVGTGTPPYTEYMMQGNDPCNNDN